MVFGLYHEVHRQNMVFGFDQVNVIYFHLLRRSSLMKISTSHHAWKSKKVYPRKIYMIQIWFALSLKTRLNCEFSTIFINVFTKSYFILGHFKKATLLEKETILVTFGWGLDQAQISPDEFIYFSYSLILIWMYVYCPNCVKRKEKSPN